ncbi:ABC transporter substrate-binding protein [Thermus thermophilus]|uniref:ABC transporter substrate-binding protein n=1 Tax=Thermus thermophilus TaxID=274 RepID=A0AAD1NWF8_THETH|nr:ABC transporter substrate-binding protein [Thermus thermophilus]BBL81621.1 ABC transporter substrate-binding protein [Thermus thermophilus]BBL83924.1 ABC transporter substrate-binding protein [Thermus thermophilus]BCZ86228.1 ABC transporter substrate-binding protein [Thermus thermophilus]BCZ88623.1 ABC transporter substrate-binding protein [Thermus thermophilus]BCZ91249.1 ABC transporter substrate-binding protein [Thermus thermophilus]
MKKALLLVAALGVAFAQQAKPEDVIKEQCAKAKVVAELWHGFTGGAPKAALENLVVEFNKAQQGRCVRPVPQGGYRDLSTKIKAAFAAGKVPTMAQAFENNIALYLEAKALLPIESLGVRLQGVNLTFLNAVRFGGVVYGVPFNKSIQVLYYNRDLLKKHGVPVPATLEEFVAAAKKLSRAEGGPVYWFQPDASTFAYFFFNLGGSYLKDGKLVLNSKEAVEALTLLQNGVKEGWAKPITSGYINQNLGSGPYAFSVDTSAGYTYYLRAAKFDLGVATLPGRTKGQPGYGLVQGTNLVVFRQAPKEEQAVAKDFLEFVLSPRAQAVFATATGYVPVTEGALKDPVYQAYAAENPDYATIVRQSRYAKFEPALAEWEQIRFDILGQAIKEAILNKADPKAALDRAQKLAEDLLSSRTR